MKNQQAALVLIAILAIGCASDSTSRDRVDARHEHPPVRMTGIDGTVFRGDLLNGSVTIDSGLGQLTLLTDHINQIDLSPMGDTVDSPSVKVSGKLRDTTFMLRSEHGVFTLAKDRLKKIEFNPMPQPPNATTASEQMRGTDRAVVVSP